MATTITASTSVVLVPTSTGSGPYIVYFPNISTSGRLITVRDNDGYASTGNAVVLSTLTGATFAGITGSLEINQSFGFITLNSQLNGSFGVLNTFAFPAGQASANVSNINTQNIYVASTIQVRDQANNSTTSIYVSSSRIVFDNTFVGDITIEELQSTVNGLGSLGYLSSLYVESFYPSWVAVGYSSNTFASSSNISTPRGTIQFSSDGQTWSNALNNGGFNSYGAGVAYGKQTYVAVGNNNTGIGAGNSFGYHQWSVDGSNWFYSLTPELNSNYIRTGVSYANGLFHSVGYQNITGGAYTVMWSADGKTWNPSIGAPFASPIGFPTAYGTGIAYGLGTWVASGIQYSASPARSLIWSIDGSNWNVASGASWSGQEVYDVAWNGSKFIATCTNGSNVNASNICASTDGKTWTSAGITNGNFNNGARYVAGNGTQWIITTNNPGRSLVYSLDNGSNWLSNANIAGCNLSMYKPYWDGSKWWIGVQTATSESLYYSADAQTWQPTPVSSQFRNGGYGRGFASTDGFSNVNLLLNSTVIGLQQSFTTQNLRVNSDNIALGLYAGQVSQGSKAIAIGREAGSNTQGTTAIAMGFGAGKTNQQNAGIAIGASAGQTFQGNSAIAIGAIAGNLNQKDSAIAIGTIAGNECQDIGAIAIGNNAGASYQSTNAIAIGNFAGNVNQDSNAIAIGYQAGFENQSTNTIVLNATGNPLNTNQDNSFYVAPIRTLASPPTSRILYYNTTTNEITAAPVTTTISTINSETLNASTITVSSLFVNVATVSTIYEEYTYISSQYAKFISTGSLIAGSIELNSDNIALGSGAGETTQGLFAVAIGCGAGNQTQDQNAIAIGNYAAEQGQLTSAIAIGSDAGRNNQNQYAIAIGTFAGRNDQSTNAIAIGNLSGFQNQDQYAIAIGNYAGNLYQGSNTIAIGVEAGLQNQKLNAIAIGYEAGHLNQKSNAIAIGYQAGFINQSTNTIVLNATGSILNTIQDNSFYVAPIRALGSSEAGTQAMFYDATTKEITAAQGINISTISTYSMTVYGSNTFTSQGSTILQGPVVANTLNVNTISSGNINIANFSPVSMLVSSISTYSMTVYGSNAIFNSNVGIVNTTPATRLVVDVANQTARSGIAIRSSDMYTIIGATDEASANAGSIQVYMDGTGSAIGTTPYALWLQSKGGTTTIGTVDNLNTTHIYGPLSVNRSVTAQNVVIGSNTAFANMASFSHSSYANTTDAALYQDSTGNTYLNSKSGQTVTFRTGNNEMGYFDAATSNLIVNGSVRIARDGTVGSPSLVWPTAGGDTDSGFYHPADGDISASINGIRRFTINGNGIDVNGSIIAGTSLSILRYLPVAQIYSPTGSGNVISLINYTGSTSYSDAKSIIVFMSPLIISAQPKTNIIFYDGVGNNILQLTNTSNDVVYSSNVLGTIGLKYNAVFL